MRSWKPKCQLVFKKNNWLKRLFGAKRVELCVLTDYEWR